MLGLIITGVLCFAAGFLTCVWFGPKNKKTYAKIRKEMEEVFTGAGEVADDLKAKVDDVLNRK